MPVWEIVLLIIALLFAVTSIGIWFWNVATAKRLRDQDTPINPHKLQKFPFKLQNFILDLGGIDNIKKTTATNNKIKVQVIDHSKINFNNLKKIKNHGILDQNDSVSLVLGAYCNNLSNAINDLIKLNSQK